MRTPLVLAAVLSLVAPAASAQATFGVRAGVGAAELTFEGDDFLDGVEGAEKRGRLGLTVGAFADVPLAGPLSLRPGVSYVQKGYAVAFDLQGDPATEVPSFVGSGTFAVDYLEVPVLLGYRFASRSGLEVTAEAGPTVGYKVRSGSDCSGDVAETCARDGFDREGDIGPVEFGGAVGVAVGAGPFGVGLRYTGSLGRVDDPDVTTFTDVRHRALTATAHYVFGR